jgi:hypothetical protein
MSSRTLLDLRRVWRPDDRAEQQIRSIAVEVPHAATALEVELEYAAAPGVVLDLGLEGPSGYAGWSGGARSRLVVSAGWATPGYLPQPVEPGVWQVLIGLHRVPRNGVEMELTVRTVGMDEVERHRAAEPLDPPAERSGPGQLSGPGQRSGPAHGRGSRAVGGDADGIRRWRAKDLPVVDGMHWLAGDFHSHTVHSDGVLSVGGLAALAASRGLDFLAVTDHNTTSHHAHLAAAGREHGILLLPGQEVTRDVGHANAFGDIGFLDFRSPPESWAKEAESRGGLLSINHPLAGDCAWLLPVDRPAVAEVWHSSWAQVPGWGAPLAWWLLTPDTVPIGGSDFHRPGHDGLPGSPTTWVLAEGDDVLGAVGAGRTAVSGSVDGPVVVRDGDDLVVLGGEGLLVTGPDRPRRRVRSDRVTVAGSSGPTWLEDDDRVVHALCR